MCGRFGLEADIAQLAIQFNFDPDLAPGNYRPNPEIAPTSRILALTQRPKTGELVPNWMHWGIYPPTLGATFKNAHPVYNARSETVHSKNTFAPAYGSRRCIIPAQFFYEFQADAAGNKLPIRFEREDRQPFAFAGIWNPHPMPQGKDQRCVIITTEPNGLVAPVHQRMPVILEPQDYLTWTGSKASPSALANMMKRREWPDMNLTRLQPAMAA